MSKLSLAALRDRRYFKEIGLLLVIKTCLIIALRICFFSHPEVRPDPVATTSAHLLGAPQAAAENSPSPANRSSHDQ